MPEGGIFCTSIEFCQRVLPEWVEATKGAKPVRILRDLLTCPIVLGPHLRVFVIASDLWAPVHVSEREHGSTLNSRGVELRNEMIGRHRFLPRFRVEQSAGEHRT